MGKTVTKLPVVGRTLGSVGDVLLGAKTPGEHEKRIDMTTPEQYRLQSKLIGEYEKLLGEDASTIAARQISEQEQMARQLAKDQEMKAKQMVAQRGLGKSSTGLNLILGQQRGLGDQISAIRSQEPALKRELRLQNLGTAASGIGSILGQQQQSQIYVPMQRGIPRDGGLIGQFLGAAGRGAGEKVGAKAF